MLCFTICQWPLWLGHLGPFTTLFTTFSINKVGMLMLYWMIKNIIWFRQWLGSVSKNSHPFMQIYVLVGMFKQHVGMFKQHVGMFKQYPGHRLLHIFQSLKIKLNSSTAIRAKEWEPCVFDSNSKLGSLQYNTLITVLSYQSKCICITRAHYWFKCLFCCSGRIPRLSLIPHSLYVGVAEKPPPPPLTGEQYERWRWNTLRVVTVRVFYFLRFFFNIPLYF